MLEINERFKELRKVYGLSQEELGIKIGLSKSGISNIESGTRNVTDKHIKLLCSEFPEIQEEWLRYGTGEMKRETPSSTMEQLKKEFDLDDFSSSFVYEYLKLDINTRNAVQEFFYNVLDGMGGRESGSTPYKEAPKTPEELERLFPPVDPEGKKETG